MIGGPGGALLGVAVATILLTFTLHVLISSFLAPKAVPIKQFRSIEAQLKDSRAQQLNASREKQVELQQYIDVLEFERKVDFFIGMLTSFLVLLPGFS